MRIYILCITWERVYKTKGVIDHQHNIDIKIIIMYLWLNLINFGEIRNPSTYKQFIHFLLLLFIFTVTVHFFCYCLLLLFTVTVYFYCSYYCSYGTIHTVLFITIKNFKYSNKIKINKFRYLVILSSWERYLTHHFITCYDIVHLQL